MTMPPRRWIAAGLLVTATLLGVAPGPAAQVRDYVTTRVAMDVGGPTDGAAYEAAPATEVPAVRLAAVGDVGTGDREEHETAQTMASLPGPPYDALVLLGDNVYPSGDPSRLDATVFGPFADVLDTADLVAALGKPRRPGRQRAPPGRLTRHARPLVHLAVRPRRDHRARLHQRR